MIALLVVILFVIDAYIVLVKTKTPPQLKEVHRRYAILRDHISRSSTEPDNFKSLTDQVPLTCFSGKQISDDVGYNINKGGEIGLCLDGTANDMFHVLIHELAHTVTKKYSHNKEFWSNYNQLKDLCIKLKIYTDIPGKRKFCGEYIRD